MPEIGLSGLLLDSPHSGTATYTRQLVKHLPVVAPDLDYCLLTSRATLEVPHIRLRTPLDGATGAAGTRLRKLVWESVALPAASALRRQAVLHSLYFAAPPVSSAPLVVTIHDLIPLIMPGHHRGRAAALYSEVMARTVKRADAVITVSQHSSEDIERVLGIPRERIFVTPEAAGEEFSTHAGPGERESVVSKYVLPDRFVLYMGGAERRKNLELLLRAWSRQKKRLRNLETRLVIVARLPEPDSLYPDTRRRARELRLEDDVRFVGAVDEADKPALLRAALGFCYPSRYEGFGLPPVEAMASGVPTLSSNATSLREVIGDGGVLLAPDDVDAWAEALVRLAESAEWRTELSHRGLRRARDFSWMETARQTAEVYRIVMQ